MTININKVSILVCTNNRPRQLESCLRSLLNQSIQVDEILVLDASDQNCINKIIDDKIKYFTTKIKSIPYSRNFLLKKAKNNLCLFVDDDVCLNKDAVLNCINFFKENTDAAMVGGIGYPKFKKNIYSMYSFKTLFFQSLNDKNNVTNVSFCPTMICGFLKDTISKYKLSFDPSLKNLEDVGLCLDLIKKNEHIYISKKIKGVHKYRTDFKSFYLSFYNYYLYTGLIYKKYGQDFFDMERLLKGNSWIQSFFYLFDGRDGLLYSFSQNKIINFWLYFLRKLAMINAVKNQKYIEK